MTQNKFLKSANHDHVGPMREKNYKHRIIFLAVRTAFNCASKFHFVMGAPFWLALDGRVITTLIYTKGIIIFKGLVN